MTVYVRRAHRDERAFLHLLTGFLFLVILVALGALINTGEVVDDKVRAQSAADAAAYSSAATISEAMNAVTGSNIAIVRTASAEALAWSVFTTADAIEENWERAIARNPLNAAKVAAEVPYLVKFLLKAGPYAAREQFRASLIARAKRIYAWQRSLNASVAAAIESDRRRLEDEFGVQLTLSQLASDTAHIKAPIRKPRGLDERLFGFHNVLQERISKDRAAWESHLSRIKVGQGASEWRKATVRNGSNVAILLAGRFHVLQTHRGLLERKPTRSERNGRFAVTAFANLPAKSREPFVLPTVFGYAAQRGGESLAFAQGETYHPADEGQPVPAWWRLWSFAGWQWEPRLTIARALPKLLLKDPRAADLMERNGSPTHDSTWIQETVRH